MAFIDELMGTAYPGAERPGVYGVNPGSNPFQNLPAAPRPAPPSDGRTNWKPPGGFGAGGAAPPPADPAPPPGFTPEQWARLLKMAKKNPKIAELIQKYTDAAGQTAEEAKWRRVMPTDTSQLLKQLSYNAGEMGMPGGYVGAIQLPAYGETQPPVNNPDMSKYGQASGLGEATFYQQSMNGGMAPIAAMSPLGVPEGWNPGGSSSGGGSNDIKDQLDKYLKGINGEGNGRNRTRKDQLQADLEAFTKAGLGGGNSGRIFASFGDSFAKHPNSAARRAKRDNKDKPTTSGNGTGTKPGVGIPISLPFGF